MSDKSLVDYSLYLVTDPSLLPSGCTLEGHIEGAIKGGCTAVQIREKECDTDEFIRKARNCLTVTRKYNVPLIINDRVDVALAVGADGIHVGQEDMDCQTVRRLVGQDRIVGVSVSNNQEAAEASRQGADYAGIGPVYDTSTKKLNKATIGPSGVREVVSHCNQEKNGIKTVAIGGLNVSNVRQVMYRSETGGRGLDGVAVVSAIMASSDPGAAATALRKEMNDLPLYGKSRDNEMAGMKSTPMLDVAEGVSKCLSCLFANPLVHHMTNNVVKNFCANVTLALGCSPTMSEVQDEAEDLAEAGNALVVNMGTIVSAQGMIYAATQYNQRGKLTLLDPVGCGASNFRRAAVKDFINGAYFDVIKGNESEICTVAGQGGKMRGVDNLSTLSKQDKIKLVQDLARRERNIIVMTGKEDVISNGERTAIVSNGHALQGSITGTGCSLGSTIAGVVASGRADEKFMSTLAAIALYNIAAERAATKAGGPGTFVPHFIDEIYSLSMQSRNGEMKWFTQAQKIEMVR